MAYHLLITMKDGATARTVSFDESEQSVVWLGMAGQLRPKNAMARIELVDARARLTALNGFYISKPSEGEWLELSPQGEVAIALSSHEATEEIRVHIRPVYQGMRCFRKIGFSTDVAIGIGRAPSNGCVYDNPIVSGQHAELRYRDGRLSIVDLGSDDGTMVNGAWLSAHQPRLLQPGDVIVILDLTIAVGSGFVLINNPRGFGLRPLPSIGLMTHEAVCESMADVEDVDSEPELFYPAPRLSKSVHPLRLEVDNPPAKRPEEEQPVIMQIGPSFLMALSSVFMAASSMQRMAEGAGFLQVAPSITMAVAMIGGSVVWPVISRAYTRRKDKRDEARRGRLYVSYLDGIENRLSDEAQSQAQILEENRRPVGELIERAVHLSPLLMNHTSVHDDFMDLRVGVGDADVAADISWPQRHFALADDRMLDAVDELSKRPPRLRDIPLAFNPARNYIAGILGERSVAWEFLRGLLVQVCAMYSYQDVKVVLVSDEDELFEWEFLTHLGHLYDASGTQRLVALGNSGMVEMDLLLEREFDARVEVDAEVLGDYGVYYIVVCANQQLAKRSEALSRLLKLRHNRGFSLIYLGRDLSDLPRECGYIIDLSPNQGANLGIALDTSNQEHQHHMRSARMFARADVQGTLSQFDPDIMVSREQAHHFALNLARARLDVPEQRTMIPDSLGFLEMYQVGNVSHLNIGQRWNANDASRTLEAPIGIGQDGDLTVLDLHENIHGPHGLIAGTTGSGKSEFIITYILSMCVNYAPDEAAFVLIDYKGGGLAGAFENDQHHLPHLAGTITNLDGGAIQRSLVSIQSELKRRQDMFNKARDITGESTIDIYKYISYYRQGILKEPLPHLFVIADEFAELKQQEPEFMDELISAARIGRSLGVHLILATQKPTGVVNDQIWSNAKFKVSLKVSDANDSREMIRREDAAEITQPGRYYMLVGYNESFSGGQAAYAGGSYSPSDSYEPRHDNAVELLDNEGSVLTRLLPTVERRKTDMSELNAVLSQIESVAASMGRQAERLWLDPLPDRIDAHTLIARYGLPKSGLVCLAGELDDPENQRQQAFEVDIAAAGNVMLYGSQNSEVDNLLQAMLYMLASTYGPGRLWIYGIDYGSGSIAAFEALPHTGGVVLTGDSERLGNLLRMLEAMMGERRSLLASAGGNFEAYNERAMVPLPRVVVALTNLASFQELNEGLVDGLIAFTRDAPRYGMHLIATAATTNTARVRLRQNFGMDIPTMLNEPTEYSNLFGMLHGVTPPQHERRGLTRRDKRLLEFQGLSIGKTDDEEPYLIEELARSVRASSVIEARPIPVLPLRVHVTDMGEVASTRRVPVGFAKKAIEPVWFDLERIPYFLVFGDDIEAMGRYLRGLHEAYRMQDETSYRFVDPQGILGDVDDGCVLREGEEIAALINTLYAGHDVPQIVVFTSIVQLVNSLTGVVAGKLQAYFTEERGAGKTGVVACSEFWRARQVYDPWYKVVISAGSGVWVGGGFDGQTVMSFARTLPEFRQQAEHSDGFLAVRGGVTSVRLLESENDEVDIS